MWACAFGLELCSCMPRSGARARSAPRAERALWPAQREILGIYRSLGSFSSGVTLSLVPGGVCSLPTYNMRTSIAQCTWRNTVWCFYSGESMTYSPSDVAAGRASHGIDVRAGRWPWPGGPRKVLSGTLGYRAAYRPPPPPPQRPDPRQAHSVERCTCVRSWAMWTPQPSATPAGPGSVLRQRANRVPPCRWRSRRYRGRRQRRRLQRRARGCARTQSTVQR